MFVGRQHATTFIAPLFSSGRAGPVTRHLPLTFVDFVPGKVQAHHGRLTLVR